MKSRLAGLLAAGGIMFTSGWAVAVPASLTYTGELMADNGLPYTGAVAVSARLFTLASGGAAVWEQDLGTLSVMNGVLQAELTGASLLAAIEGSATLWLEFEVEGETLSPRQKLTSVPYAAVAGTSSRVGSIEAADIVTSSNIESFLQAPALPTDGINQVSNGALENRFMGVTSSWAGSQNILDDEPAAPPPPASTSITTAEGAGSYLTGIAIHTKIGLNFHSVITMRLVPPPSSGVGPIFLRQSANMLSGTYDETWTVANAPGLTQLLGQEVAGTWTLEVQDLDDDGAGSPAIGTLQTFEVMYDVVRANHLIVNGRLDVQGDVVATGEMVRKVQAFTIFADDGVSNGKSGTRVFNFTKKHAGTNLLVTYSDNFRCEGSGERTCFWRLRVNDQDCTSPGPMQVSLYNNGGDYINVHRQGQATFVCTAVNGQPIPAGSHQMSVHEVKLGSWQEGNPFLGWPNHNGSQNPAVFTIEEIY